MNNLSFCWNCWIRCVEIEVICVALIFFIAFLFCNSCNIVAVSTCIHPAFARKFRLWQLWKMFLVRTVWLIPANGWLSNTAAYFSRLRFNGRVLLVIGGRSNAFYAFLTSLQYSVLPLNGCAASFTWAGLFLAFTLLLELPYCFGDLCRSF